MPDELEEVLKATVAIALETGTAKPSGLERVTVDTAVQEKAIAHPTAERGTTAAFSRLYLKALLTSAGQAKKAGVRLRQSRTRLAKRAAVKAGRDADARQCRRMRRELERLTYLGQVLRFPPAPGSAGLWTAATEAAADRAV